MQSAYRTEFGEAFSGDSLDLLRQMQNESIDLVITSPPFALQREKEYGNKDQASYIDWLTEFAQLVFKKLKPSGSFVLDLGGAYQKGAPSRSLYNFRVLIKFCDELGFHLAQEFFWNNPSKLPSPIEWVNKRKIRVKDSVNTIWWFSKTEWPKADISKVLVPYSDRMKKLLDNPDRYYSAAQRPSGHGISKGFATDNGGAIPSNLLNIANSESNGNYTKDCKLIGARVHPARFPAKIPEFFIKMLTDENDLVVDIFGGSNTTGRAAETEARRWISCDLNPEYVAASALRFLPSSMSKDEKFDVYTRIVNGETLDLQDDMPMAAE
ncbi:MULTISPECIES: site-specific DNA-methyltransferase [unclassified Sphingopyxis]|uniref:DNA-methyltransferase n=1 Tax=unclassified Sphingopyxis TaxID=2614943 RepID=UPI0007312C85|nr:MULTISPECIES: site-specific DNA-methyltransferase [unclassified Sphingopyxis]KTE21534.1 DNA methyltransferase [Sphingopyxis sp. H057]KTE49531.1 DNA methyltransferase [Sphingopyxis sp. H073]KTE49811.1 DNA methyltransferase [Sphingopyxis sp. H071]KTE58157.1 DNA methyltransferase [Sphingopyxis sp. H107]KTE62694.1 DNA methyltransferase [Sphingopyxis sp. H100]